MHLRIMLLPSYFDLHRIEANAVFGHLFKMTSPLTDHAIGKHVNCQQLGTVDSFQCDRSNFARVF